MATSWAVGSATMLGLAAAALAIGGERHAATVWYVFFGMIPLVAVWAYAISMGAHGSRTPLAALTVYVTVASLASLYLEWPVKGTTSGAPLGAALGVATALVGALTLWALLDELRRRGGPIRVGTVIALLLPLVPTVYAVWAARLMTAIVGGP